MIIIDFFVAAYFSIGGNKREKKSLEAAILVLKMPFVFNIFTLFLYVVPPLLGKFIKIQTNSGIWTFMFLTGIIILFGISKFLDKRYSNKYEYIKTLYNKVPRLLLMLFMLIHFFGSILWFCGSLWNIDYIIAPATMPMPY